MKILKKAVRGSLMRVASLVALVAPLGSAATIAAVDPPDTYSRGLVGAGIGTYSLGWSQLDTYENVVIRVGIQELVDQVGVGGSIAAFLTDQVGAGTTQAANELAPDAIVPFGPSHSGLLTVFSGLTLGPGDYYVTITGDTGLAHIGETGSPSPTLAPNVTILGYGIDCCSVLGYLPAQPAEWTNSAWTFEVTGDLVEETNGQIPEPSTMALVAGGLAAVVLRRRRKS